MSEYRLDFPISAGSPEPLRQIAQAATSIDKSVGDATKSITAMEKSNARLSQSIDDLRRQVSSAAPAIRAISDEQNRAAVTSATYTRSTQQLGEAHRHAVTDIQAASAAIRTMEGHLSIRAVEQYTTKILGMGGAFQALFPVIGAAAFVNVLEQTVSKIGEMYNAFSPFVRAQKESLEVIKAIADESDRISQKQRQAIVSDAQAEAERRLKGSGRAAGLRAEATLLTQDAMSPQLRVGDMTYSPEYIRSKRAEIAARVTQYANDNSQAGLSVRRVAEEELRKLAEVESMLNDKASLAAREAGAKRLQAESADRDRAEQEAAKARATYNQFSRQAARLGSMAEFAEAGPYSSMLVARQQFGQALSDNESLSAGDKKKLLQQYAEAFDQEFRAVSMKVLEKNMKDIGKYLKTDAGSAGLDTNSRDFAQDLQNTIRFGDRQVSSMSASLAQFEGVDLAGLRRAASQSSRFAMASLSGPGRERQAIDIAYSEREKIAELEYQADAKRAQRARELAEIEMNQAGASQRMREEAQAKLADAERLEFEARAMREKELADARMDRELSLLQLRKRGEDDFARTAEGGFQALVSGGGRGLSQFARGQAIGWGSTIVGNAARMVYRPGAFSLTSDPNSGLGRLLAGTPFGASSGDKLSTAGDRLSKSAADLSAAAQVLASGGGAVLPGGGTVGSAAGVIGTLGGGSITGGIGGLAGLIGPGGTSGFAGPLGKLFSAGSTGAGFMTGFSSIANVGNAYKILAGRDFSVETANGTNTASNLGMLDTSSKIGAGVGLATAGIVGGVTAKRQFSRGNTLGGVGTLLGTAAVFDPEPISKGILMAASAMIALFGGDPKQRRQDAINKTIGDSKFYDPVALNISAGLNGGLTDYDRFGNLRGSDLSPYPQTQAPYMDYRNNTYVPGRVVSGYGGNGPGLAPNVTVNINALDSQSIMDRASDITAAVAIGVQRDGSGTQLMDAMRQQL